MVNATTRNYGPVTPMGLSSIRTYFDGRRVFATNAWTLDAGDELCEKAVQKWIKEDQESDLAEVRGRGKDCGDDAGNRLAFWRAEGDLFESRQQGVSP